MTKMLYENGNFYHYLYTQQSVRSMVNRRTYAVRQFDSSRQYKVLMRLVKCGLYRQEKDRAGARSLHNSIVVYGCQRQGGGPPLNIQSINKTASEMLIVRVQLVSPVKTSGTGAGPPAKI
jgi:hypothetical protein